MVVAHIMFFGKAFHYLIPAVVARCQYVLGACGHHLIELDLAVRSALLGKPALQGAAAAATAVVVGTAGNHIDKIFFTHNGLDHEAHVVRHLIAPGLAHDVAGILAGELNFQVFVPVGIDLKLALADPLGVEGDDACEVKLVLDVEFFESFQDCKE